MEKPNKTETIFPLFYGENHGGACIPYHSKIHTQVGACCIVEIDGGEFAGMKDSTQ